MKELAGIRAKIWAYLVDDGSEKKKQKGIKKCITKKELMLENYIDCLFNSKTILKSQQGFKSDHHDVYTVEINKIALSSNDDKRLETFENTTTYPHGTNAFKVCKSEMLLIIDCYKTNNEDEIMFGIC